MLKGMCRGAKLEARDAVAPSDPEPLACLPTARSTHKADTRAPWRL